MSIERQIEVVRQIAEIAARFAEEVADVLTPRGRELYYDYLMRRLADQREGVDVDHVRDVCAESGREDVP